MSEAAQRSNLATRTLTAIVLLAVATAALVAGKTAFWLLVFVLGLAMALEWARLVGAAGWRAALGAVLIAGVLLFVLPLFRPIDETSLLVALAAAVAAGLVGTSLRLGFGILYIGLATVAIVFLRETAGLVPTLWTLVTVWATDIGAYFAGRSIGGPKLAPALSPNKTWAGLIGGLACAMIAAGVFVYAAGLPPRIVPLAGALAVLAQCGDLFESWLKRRAGVKDSSNLFPGHGGALDRLDGLLPVAICVAAMTAQGWL